MAQNASTGDEDGDVNVAVHPLTVQVEVSAIEPFILCCIQVENDDGRLCVERLDLI